MALLQQAVDKVDGLIDNVTKKIDAPNAPKDPAQKQSGVRYTVKSSKWHPNTVQGVLASRGIRASNFRQNEQDGSFAFTVKDAQAEHAEYWMRREGIPFTGGLNKRPNVRKWFGKLGGMFGKLGKSLKGITKGSKADVARKVGVIGGIGALAAAAAFGPIGWAFLPMPILALGILYKSPKWGSVALGGYGALWGLAFLL